jgi:hypothetical protein
MRGYPVFGVPTEAPRPPREMLRTRRWGQFFGAPLSYLELFTRQSTTGSWEVPELEVRERPPSTLRNALTVGPREVPVLEVRKLETWMASPWEVLVVGPAAATTEVEDVEGGPSGGCWRQGRQRPPPMLETSMAGPLGVLQACPAAATTEV